MAVAEAARVDAGRRSARHGWARAALVYAAYWIASALFVFPFAWALSGSLKNGYQIEEIPPRWIPNPVLWENYARIWEIVPLAQYIGNTVVVTGLSLVGQLTSAALVAYGFARFRFPGRDKLFLLVLSSLMLPVHITLIPTFVMFYKIG